MAFASSDLLCPHNYKLLLRLAVPEGVIWGFHVPYQKVCWVRCLLLTGKLISHETVTSYPSSCFRHLLVQVYQRLSLADRYDLYHRFTYVHLTSLLALTRICRYQEGLPLTIESPHEYSCFVTLSEPLFIQAPSIIQWHGWPPLTREATFRHSLVSQ